MFRVDRITALEPTTERFEITPGRDLTTFLVRTTEEEGCEQPPDLLA